MASENAQRLQDTFLDHLLTKKVPVTVFLINGVKLQGLVAAHDAFCIMLARDGQSQAIYKQAVSTLAPAYPVDLWEGDGKEGDDAAPRRAPPAARTAKPDFPPRRGEKVVVVERKPTRPRRTP